MSLCECVPPAEPPAGADHVASLFSSLYAELCRLARREVWRSGAREWLGTGTLVHEAWLDLSRRPGLRFEERDRFLAYAARTMRGLVIDRLRAQTTLKRGGGVRITSLQELDPDHVAEVPALQGLDDALDALAALEPALARVVELKFLCGFTIAEIAVMQETSERTVQRQWEKARLLLHAALA